MFFLTIAVLLKIACTLPVGSCEKLSPQHMGEDRLSRLTLMNLNHEMETDVDTVSHMFIQKNNRRMFVHIV